MGYYEDLIKEKQNAKPFYTPDIPMKELKTKSEVERYMFEQRRKVDECIRWMEMAKKRIEDTEKEPKPHSIGWADRLGKAKDSYKTYKRWMEMHEDFAAKAESWLSKNRNAKDNEKEEKENYKRVKKEEYKGNIIEVFETAKDKYIYISYKKGSTTMNKYGYGDASSVSEAINRAKNAIFVNNSKEEKGYYAKLAEEKKQK